MDNIIYFFPPNTPPNAQMNHVGFCTAVTFVAERFAPQLPVDEIQLDSRRIALYSPLPNYWMSLETDASFDATISKPLLQKAYAAFTFRYGPDAFVQKGSSALALFFDLFSLFLQNSVMTGGPEGFADGAGSAHSIGGPSSGPSRRSRIVAESLLNCPVSLLAASTFAFGLINSVVAQYLSLITTQMSVSSNSANIHDVQTSLVTDPATTSAPMEGADRAFKPPPPPHRAAWVLSQYALIHSEELKVMTSTMGQRSTSLLLFLLMLEPQLGSFVANFDGRQCFCFVTRAENVIFFLFVEDAVQQQLHTAVEICSAQLARDISELLKTGSCSILRDNPTSRAVVQATLAQTNPSKRLSHHQVPTSTSYCVLCYNRGVVNGPPMHLMPRSVCWQLAGAVRQAMIDVAEIKPLVGTDDLPGEDDAADEWLLDAYNDNSLGPASSLGRRRHRMLETWQPLYGGAGGWLYSCQRNGRVVAVAFDSSRTLGDCFDIAAKVVNNMFHGTHMFSPEGTRR
jgi:hypothetical protein